MTREEITTAAEWVLSNAKSMYDLAKEDLEQRIAEEGVAEALRWGGKQAVQAEARWILAKEISAVVAKANQRYSDEDAPEFFRGWFEGRREWFLKMCLANHSSTCEFTRVNEVLKADAIGRGFADPSERVSPLAFMQMFDKLAG